jgi:predicted site-specific integrase-resolvase
MFPQRKFKENTMFQVPLFADGMVVEKSPRSEHLNEIETLFQVKRNGEKRRICYARVSSAHQIEDLERQVEDLRRKYPNYEIIQDIGSGLNWHRKGFEKMMKDVMDGKIEEIVCTHKDRLCRFGFELVEMIFQKFGVSLVVLNVNKTRSQDYQQELAEDLLAVVNVFVAKNNGKRASENRKRRKREEEEKASKKRKS